MPRDICLLGNEIWVLNLTQNRLTACSLSREFLRSYNLGDIFWVVAVENLCGKPLIEKGGWSQSTHQLYLRLSFPASFHVSAIRNGRVYVHDLGDDDLSFLAYPISP